jgi:hypothetical protein
MTTGELNYGEDNLKKKEQSRQFDCVDEHSKWHDPPQVQTKADGTHRPRPRLERDCRRKGERSQPTDFFFFFFSFLKNRSVQQFRLKTPPLWGSRNPHLHFTCTTCPDSLLFCCFPLSLSLPLLILEWLEASKRRRPSSSS